jgi:hypothetical protein
MGPARVVPRDSERLALGTLSPPLAEWSGYRVQKFACPAPGLVPGGPWRAASSCSREGQDSCRLVAPEALAAFPMHVRAHELFRTPGRRKGTLRARAVSPCDGRNRLNRWGPLSPLLIMNLRPLAVACCETVGAGARIVDSRALTTEAKIVMTTAAYPVKVQYRSWITKLSRWLWLVKWLLLTALP